MTRTRTFAWLMALIFAAGLAACSSQPAPAPPAPTVDKDQLAVFAPLPASVPPESGALNADAVTLGRMLYYEPRLSKSQTISCNTCHDLANYGVDGEPTSDGHKGQKGDRNSPTVYNAAAHFVQFWDGRAPDVEAQAKGPVLNPVEMAMPGEAKVVANWMLGEVSAALNRAETEIGAAPVGAAALAGLLKRIADGTISTKIAKDVFDAMWAGEAAGDGAADTLIEKKGLKQISDEGALARLVDEVLAANPAIVAEFRAGKEKAFNSLVGKAMAASKGKANPAQINALLRLRLGG